MRRSPASTLVLTFLLVWATPASAQLQLLSPGPLTRDHAELEGDDNCERCHSTGGRLDERGCIAPCHTDLGESVRARRGLHGGEYRNQPCARCHVEHLGRESRLVRWPGGRRESFDHDLTGYELGGAHRDVECRDCHDRRNSRGHRTYLGQSTRCGSCHEDPHANRLGTNCTSCHNDRSWEAVRLDRFNHDQARFTLRGRHASVDCQECHGRPARYTDLSFGSCGDCHRDPHLGRFPRCAQCHSENGWEDVERVRTNHPGTSLRGGHRQVACGACHDEGVAYRPSGGTQCVSCHRPVHEANLGRNCQQCHGAIRWLGLPRRVGLRAHRRTEFPLRGGHSDVECGDCHRDDLSVDERFRGLESDTCAACHEDPHAGRLAQHSEGECGACHTDRGFSPAAFGVEMHAATSYPLVGFHEIVPCSGCHGTEHPRTDFQVSDRRCASCHENPHGDQFAAEMRQGGCAQCHAPTGWDRPNIDHSSWPLAGAHSLIHCNSCHEPSDEDRQSGQGASYRGVPTDCSGCHEDRHAGQFRLTEPVLGCDECHSATEFTISDFDHEQNARYPLVARHAEAACEACHTSTVLRNGTEVVRYRLGYRDCGDCHADPHAQGGRR